MDEFIRLKIGEAIYEPVLINLEEVYGLKDSRNITIVFVPEDASDEAFYNAEEFEFTYDDEIFGTGINHFRFKRSDLNNTPQFIYWN